MNSFLPSAMNSFVPAPRYTHPHVPLVLFENDITDIKGINAILENARRTIAARLFGYTVKLASEMCTEFPLPLLAEDMDTANGKIVVYDPSVPYDEAGYLTAKKEKARTGKWPKDTNRPRRVAVITKPFLLGPRSKPNGLGNDKDMVDNKPTKEGDQKRSVLTNAYPPFSCLVADQLSGSGKPYNTEMDNIVGFASNFRRSVCDYLRAHDQIEFKSESSDKKINEVNIGLLEMRVACKNKDRDARFAAYDDFLSKFCHANVKTPKSRGGDMPQQPMTPEEKLKALKASATKEVTRFTGDEYAVFRTRVGFPKKETSFKYPGVDDFVHRNPTIRTRLAEIDAAVKGGGFGGGFAYSVPLIYFINNKTKQWTLMSPEQADSDKWPHQQKLIVSVMTAPEFTPNGGPGMTMVRLPITALFVWGEAGDHVPSNFGGGVATVGEELKDADALACLDGLRSIVNPEDEPDGFSHMPQSDARRGTKRSLSDGGDDQAMKRPNMTDYADLTHGVTFDIPTDD